MDDPLLADRLKSTALNAPPDAPAAPLTYRYDTPATETEQPEQSARVRGRTAPAEGGEPTPREPDEQLTPVEALLEADRVERAEQVLQEKPRPVRELLVTLLLTSLGVVIAYYLAGQQGMDPTFHMATGGALGLLFGWLCIRWMRPRR
jgi:hypothetical protein